MKYYLQMAQQVFVAQQQQRALAVAAVAQQNAAQAAANPLFQATALQNFARNLMANGIIHAQQQGGQCFLCILCMKQFNSQASFTLHLSFHFPGNIFTANHQQRAFFDDLREVSFIY